MPKSTPFNLVQKLNMRYIFVTPLRSEPLKSTYVRSLQLLNIYERFLQSVTRISAVKIYPPLPQSCHGALVEELSPLANSPLPSTLSLPSVSIFHVRFPTVPLLTMLSAEDGSANPTACSTSARSSCVSKSFSETDAVSFASDVFSSDISSSNISSATVSSSPGFCPSFHSVSSLGFCPPSSAVPSP